MVTSRRLRSTIDEGAVLAAIRDAEARTSGEIRVSISRFFVGDVVSTAERAFDRLGMRETKARNGVLFFVVPSRRRFAVIGDAGIHARLGDDGWASIAAVIAERFHAGDFTGGLVHGIARLADLLEAPFPHQPGDVNELPDRIDRV